MPLKTIPIRFPDPEVPLETASELLSYIAFPLQDDNRRRKFAAALCRFGHRHEMIRDPIWGKLIRPFVFAPDEQTFYRDLHFGLETLRRHLITASLILHPHFESLKTGKPLPTIEGLSPTVDNVTQVLARLEGWDEFESQSTFESRVWTSVRPVAHLAFCFFHKVFKRRIRSTLGQDKGMFEIISPYPDEETLRDIVLISEKFRKYLPKLKPLRFVENQTIEFVESAVSIIGSADTHA
jgi:hypothetical protein